MADFINTIDVLGDGAVIDSIINRTITEFKDDSIITVGQYSFYGCASLQSVKLPNAIRVGAHAFSECPALAELDIPSVKTLGDSFTTIIQNSGITHLRLPSVHTLKTNALRAAASLKCVDLPICTTIGSYCFAMNTSMTTLILRSETICTLDNVNSFLGTYQGNYTPIGKGEGYIYVPKALLSDDDATKDYRRATNWAEYSSQFRELEAHTVDGTITGELDESKI